MVSYLNDFVSGYSDIKEKSTVLKVKYYSRSIFGRPQFSVVEDFAENLFICWCDSMAE